MTDTIVTRLLQEAAATGTKPTFRDIAIAAGYGEDDLKRVDTYWDIAFNKSWLYLSDHVIFRDLGYAKTKSCRTKLYERITKEYINIVEYEEVTKDHEIVQMSVHNVTDSQPPMEEAKIGTTGGHGGSSRRYFIITGETFKNLAMSAGTDAGRATRMYYIKTERLAAIMREVLMQLEIIERDKVIAEKEAEVKEKDAAIAEKDAEAQRLYDINKELLTYKKHIGRDESIYIVSAWRYAVQGLFKIGRTKTIKARSSGHNTSHPTGDAVKVLAEFKVNNATTLETDIHKKLSGLRSTTENEFFACPFNMLWLIVKMVTDNDSAELDAVNTIVDSVYELHRKTKLNPAEWTAGLDMDAVFGPALPQPLPAAEAKVKEKRVSAGTVDLDEDSGDLEEKRRRLLEEARRRKAADKEAILRCMVGLDKKKVVWKTFKEHLRKELGLSTKQFKIGYWKDLLEEVAEDNTYYVVQWKGD